MLFSFLDLKNKLQKTGAEHSMEIDYTVAAIGICIGLFLIYTSFWTSFCKFNMGVVCTLFGMTILSGNSSYKNILVILLLAALGTLMSIFFTKSGKEFQSKE